MPGTPPSCTDQTLDESARIIFAKAAGESNCLLSSLAFGCQAASKTAEHITTLNSSDHQHQTKHQMAPAANTARLRRVPGSPADLDSDVEFHAYNSRLKEASAARVRLRKVSIIPSHPPPLSPFMEHTQLTPYSQAQDTRDKKRAALTTAHSAALSTIESRIQTSLAKHNALRQAPPFPLPLTPHLY